MRTTRLFLHDHGRFGLAGRRGLRVCRSRILRARSSDSRCASADRESLRLETLDGVPAHTLDALREIGAILELPVRFAFVENRPGFRRTDTLASSFAVLTST